MLLFRTATKQLCKREGLHASFMSRPALPNFFSSGWHLHQSLTDLSSGGNAFKSNDGEVLSEVGRRYVAGIIDHAIPMSLFANPTITGYKRLKPYSFAPDRANWARENRGAYVRVQGEPGEEGTHIENRSGEPAANPYLYMAANLAAGLDGIKRELEPPPIVDGDPYASESTPLPTTLWEAVDAVENDEFFNEAFGKAFMDYIVMAKRSEIGRFLSEVTDWEHREYFEFY
jgi:glutamine synthetase